MEWGRNILMAENILFDLYDDNVMFLSVLGR